MLSTLSLSGPLKTSGLSIRSGGTTRAGYYKQIKAKGGQGENRSIILTPLGTGALIFNDPPNSLNNPGGPVNIGFGSGNARGSYAVDLQRASSYNSGAGAVASGQSSNILGGVGNTASGTGSSVVGGSRNIASGNYATVGGGGDLDGNNTGNTASGNWSTVPGGFRNTASAQNSIAIGGGALADRYGMLAQAPNQGVNGVNGVYQSGRFVLYCKTTTSSAVEMALDGGTTYLTIPSGKIMAMTINIAGVASDGSAVSHYLRQYAAKNVGGTYSEVYPPVIIGNDNAAGTSISITTAATYISIKPTGVLNQTWRWTAVVDAAEIIYGT